jgi:hypothetical protein
MSDGTVPRKKDKSRLGGAARKSAKREDIRLPLLHAFFLLVMIVALGATAFFAPRQFLLEHYGKFVASAYALAFASLFVSKDKLLHIPTKQEIRAKGPTAFLAILFVIMVNLWFAEIEKYEKLRLRLVGYCTTVRAEDFGPKRIAAEAEALSIVGDLNALWSGDRPILEDKKCSDSRSY